MSGLGATREPLTRGKNAPLRLRLEREDLDDGSITYHLWDRAGNWIVGLNDAEDKQGNLAREYARAIVTAVNAFADSGKS